MTKYFELKKIIADYVNKFTEENFGKLYEELEKHGVVMSQAVNCDNPYEKPGHDKSIFESTGELVVRWNIYGRCKIQAMKEREEFEKRQRN